MIDADGRVITSHYYDEIGSGDRIMGHELTDLWGKRDGKFYLISPADGHETGTFSFQFRSSEDHFEDVDITWFK